MSLPNRLTVLRIFLTFVFIFFALREGIVFKIAAMLTFVLASWTDFYDGYYAKKHNLVSDFGKLMDPIADKFLVLAAFFIFALMHLIQAWMFILIFIREAGVTLIRLYALRRGKVLAAERAGKVKTVLQMLGICAILVFMILAEPNLPAHWPPSLLAQFYHAIYFLMLAVVAVTVFSGISFVWNNRRSIYA